jgi:hypothetical protein
MRPLSPIRSSRPAVPDDESARQRRALFPRALQVRAHCAPLSRSAREHVFLSSRPADESFGSGTVDLCDSISCRNAERSGKASRRHALILWRAWRPSGVVRLIWAARAHVWRRRCGPACGLMTEVRPRWRGRSAERQVSASPPQDALPISTDRGDGTRPRCRCVPAARDPATGTCPTASRDRARTQSRCGRRRRSRVRRRLCRGPRA